MARIGPCHDKVNALLTYLKDNCWITDSFPIKSITLDLGAETIPTVTIEHYVEDDTEVGFNNG